jgi:hypothetical protein
MTRESQKPIYTTPWNPNKYACRTEKRQLRVVDVQIGLAAVALTEFK